MQGTTTADTLQRLTRQFLAVATHSVDDAAELTLPQMRLLFAVEEHPGASCAELARALAVAGSTVTRVADRLVDTGHLRRSHGDRGRVIVELELTDKGTAAIDDVVAWRSRFFADLVADLDNDPAAVRALTTVSAALDAALSTEVTR
ncbi:MarR family transcriptional regulator [Flexivirga meconopsidis]|uniref:MarR family transcriptional regulator n=1 Tax=Flexivirga meconopsidis TaxID=2977121 RepID=UPI00223E92D2|nr:MarR family transcriptional regulator [Flexivirga meconopsidis]